MGMRISRSMVELTPEREAIIRARRKIRPDEPGTNPGDPGNGRVFVLNDRIQIFNGKRYRKAPDGYFINDAKIEGKSKIEFLHVAVWQFHNGTKPKGYIVHHDRRDTNGNWNAACNDIEWLLLMTYSEHKLYHSKYNPSIELICKSCHKIFWGRNHNEKYCAECSGKNTAAAQNGTILSLTEALAVESDSTKILRATNDNKQIRICFFCHRPFEVDEDSMELACDRPDCRGREYANAYEQAMNNVLKDLTEHCGCFFKFFSQRFNEPIRCLFIDGEIWFVAKDVAKALGYKEPARAVRTHVKSKHKKTIDRTNFGSRKESPSKYGAVSSINSKLVVINEIGFYRFCFTSKLPEAEEFTEWVTSIVLPAIRKYSQYVIRDETAPILFLPENTSLVLVNADDEPFCFSDNENGRTQFGIPVSSEELIDNVQSAERDFMQKLIPAYRQMNEDDRALLAELIERNQN